MNSARNDFQDPVATNLGFTKVAFLPQFVSIELATSSLQDEAANNRFTKSTQNSECNCKQIKWSRLSFAMMSNVRRPFRRDNLENIKSCADRFIMDLNSSRQDRVREFFFLESEAFKMFSSYMFYFE